MANQLHIYYGNPTANATDGTEASSGTELSPIAVTLDASQAEAKAVKCAVRCDTGYYIEGNTTISFVGTNTAKWKVAEDNNYADAEPLSPTPHGRILLLFPMLPIPIPSFG